MPPKGSRGGRITSAATAASGRTSLRIAAKQTEAQQQATQAAEAASHASGPPDSPLQPPATVSREGGGGIGRARVSSDGEKFARRFVAPGRRDGAGRSPSTFSKIPNESEALGSDDDAPRTPTQMSAAANRVYADYPNSSQQNPRTQNATANLMNKFVDRLRDASNDLLIHLAIDGQNRNEAWIKELKIHQNIFERYYEIYTMDTTPYIDIDAVSEYTKSSDNANLWLRMTQAVATANLASLLSQVESLEADNVLPVLQRIDEYFPAAFIPGGRGGLHGQNRLIDDATIKQAFAVRAQRFIETLRNYGQGADPLRTLAMVFFDQKLDDEISIDSQLDKASIRPFDGFELTAVEAKQYQERIHRLRKVAHLQWEDAMAQWTGIESDYNFGKFLAGFKDWIKASGASLSDASQVRTDAVYYNNSPSSAGAQLQDEANTSRFAPSGINALKQGLNPDHPAIQQVQQHSPYMGEAAAYPFGPESMAGTDLEVYQMGHGMSSSQNEGLMYAAHAAQAATQNSSGGPSRKRNRKGTGNGNTQAKRARDFAAMPPPSSFPAPDPNAPMGSPSVELDPEALSVAAKLITKANKKQAMPKTRRPWTVHDTQQLVRAIHVYKAKWSSIQKAIELHHVPFNVIDRDQQALRDKARLVKVDILKTDSPLPPSFDMVVLGRKEKEMVINAGKNPNRREADVDANGKAINTLYDPNAPEPPPFQAASQQAPQVAANDVDDAEMNDLRPLQEEAQMAIDMNNQMGQRAAANGEDIGGAPDAPMMTGGDVGRQSQFSEELGEALPAQNSNDAPPIDPDMMPADAGVGQG